MGFVLFLVAFLALSVLATVIFALGASIGYRNGVDDGQRVAEEHPARSRLGLRTDALASRRMGTSYHRWHGSTERSAESRRGRRGRSVDTAHQGSWQLPFPLSPGSDLVSGHDQPEQPTAARAQRHPAVRWGALVLAGVVLVTPATVALAANSVPGDALWRAKRGSEDIRLALAQDASVRTQLHLRFAARRLSELSELMMGDAGPGAVGMVSSDLQRHLRGAADSVTGVQGSHDANAPVAGDSVQRLLQQVAVLSNLADVRCANGTLEIPDCAELEAALAASSSAVAAVDTAAADGAVAPLDRDQGPARGETSSVDIASAAQDTLTDRGRERGRSSDVSAVDPNGRVAPGDGDGLPRPTDPAAADRDAGQAPPAVAGAPQAGSTEGQDARNAGDRGAPSADPTSGGATARAGDLPAAAATTPGSAEKPAAAATSSPAKERRAAAAPSPGGSPDAPADPPTKSAHAPTTSADARAAAPDPPTATTDAAAGSVSPTADPPAATGNAPTGTKAPADPAEADGSTKSPDRAPAVAADRPGARPSGADAGPPTPVARTAPERRGPANAGSPQPSGSGGNASLDVPTRGPDGRPYPPQYRPESQATGGHEPVEDTAADAAVPPKPTPVTDSAPAPAGGGTTATAEEAEDPPDNATDEQDNAREEEEDNAAEEEDNAAAEVEEVKEDAS